MPTIEATHTPTEPTSPHRRPIIIAAAGSRRATDRGRRGRARRQRRHEHARTNHRGDRPQTAEEVARGFVEAYGAFDADRALSYLADDADITGLIDWFTSDEMQGTRDELRLVISLQQAQHLQQMLDSCNELSSSATGTSVRCTFDFKPSGPTNSG